MRHRCLARPVQAFVLGASAAAKMRQAVADGFEQQSTPVVRGAAAIIDLATVSLDVAARLLSASVFTWARDPEIYALVIDARAMPAGSAADHAASQTLATALWRLDCFSKPTLTLLGAAPPIEAIALVELGKGRKNRVKHSAFS